MKSSAKKPVLLKQPYCLLRMNYDELYFNIWNYEKVNYLKNINDSLEMGPASGKDCLSKNINFIFLDVVLFWWYVLCFWSAFQGVELSLGRMEFLGEGMLCSGDRPAECWGESLVDAVCFQLTWIFPLCPGLHQLLLLRWWHGKLAHHFFLSDCIMLDPLPCGAYHCGAGSAYQFCF